jgi:signal transduction histidine kinase
VSRGDAGVEVSVRNGEPQAPATSTLVGGHGLVGMRERVALYGGVWSAGTDPSGGFRVHAVLPLDGTGP